MRKWEKDYEEYKNGKLEEKIGELKKKVDYKTCTKEEYKEFEKLGKIKQSLPQIENILEYRNKAKSLLKEVDKELIRREDLKEANKQNEELETNLKELEKKQEELGKELKNKNLSDEERESKKAEIKQLVKEKDKNNLKFSENEKILNDNIGYKSELSDKTNKELESLALNLSSRISKCNIAARNMVEGKNWSNIENELKNFKERTTYKPTRRKLSEMKNKEENKEENRKVSPEEERITENIEKIMEEKAKNELEEKVFIEELEEQNEEQNKNFVTKFLDKHPKIKGVFNKIKSIFNKESALPEGNSKEEDLEVKELKEEEPEVKELKEEEPKKEAPVTEKELGLREDFMKQLRIIADKGVEEEKRLREDEKKEKLAKFRENNGYRKGEIGAEHGTRGKVEENDKIAQEKIDDDFIGR